MIRIFNNYAKNCVTCPIWYIIIDRRHYTFVFFFIFIGNISGMPMVGKYASMLLGSRPQVITTSVVFSQFMSNVPAAILLSGFSNRYRDILLGVNLGGIGTLIASLANLISIDSMLLNTTPRHI
jgi:Na+/H+ antiporter NhaD/arsenite permease-like protein